MNREECTEMIKKPEPRITEKLTDCLLFYERGQAN